MDGTLSIFFLLNRPIWPLKVVAFFSWSKIDHIKVQDNKVRFCPDGSAGRSDENFTDIFFQIRSFPIDDRRRCSGF